MEDFTEMFDQWAQSYDSTVFGTDHEYKEVFENYQLILEEIAQFIHDKKLGTVMEVGVGTGNLSRILSERGHHVIGIEPSTKMREEAAKKLSRVTLLNGHFLDIPIHNKVDSIVTSYAFHHLNLKEKEEALIYLDSLLNRKGKIVIADTMFISKDYKEALHKKVKEEGALNLLNDLQTEYYELLEDVTGLFDKFKYTYEVKQMNQYVWLILAEKRERD